VKRAGFTLDIEAPPEVLQKFKGDLKLEMTPTRTAKQIYIYNVKAEVCCLPLGKTTCLCMWNLYVNSYRHTYIQEFLCNGKVGFSSRSSVQFSLVRELLF